MIPNLILLNQANGVTAERIHAQNFFKEISFDEDLTARQSFHDAGYTIHITGTQATLTIPTNALPLNTTQVLLSRPDGNTQDRLFSWDNPTIPLEIGPAHSGKWTFHLKAYTNDKQLLLYDTPFFW